MTNSIYSPHMQGNPNPMYDWIQDLNPRLIKIMDQPKREVVQRLNNLVPDALLWAREYIHEGDLEARIRSNARQAAQFTMNRLERYWEAGYDAGSLQNEILVFDPEGLKIIDEYQQHVMEMAPAGKIMVIGHINVGHVFLPGDWDGYPIEDYPHGGYSIISDSLDMCQAQGHILSIHAYGRPENFWHKSPWLLSRFETQFMEGVFKRWPGLLMTYGEIGTSDKLDKVNGKHGGHRWSMGDDGMTEAFLQHESYLREWSDHLISAHTFTNSAFAPFEKSEMNSVCHGIAQAQTNSPTNLKTLVNIPGTIYTPKTGGGNIDTPLVHTIWKTTSSLNFRTSANSSSSGNKIRTLAEGEEVIVMAIAGEDPEWYQVKDIKEGVVGYVHGDYIVYVRDITDPEPAPSNLEEAVAKLTNVVDKHTETLGKFGDQIVSLSGALSSTETSLSNAIARITELEKGGTGNGGGGGTVVRDLSDGWRTSNLNIWKPNEDVEYQLALGFTSHNGSMEYNEAGTVFHINEHYARKVLLSWDNPLVNKDLGADTHVHVGLVDSDGNVIRDLPEDIHFKIWWDTHPNGRDGTWKILDRKSGAANWPIGDHKYNPSNGEQGVLYIAMVDSDGNEISEVVGKFALPFGWHVSFFCYFTKI